MSKKLTKREIEKLVEESVRKAKADPNYEERKKKIEEKIKKLREDMRDTMDISSKLHVVINY